jgi:serine/threonine protein kinase
MSKTPTAIGKYEIVRELGRGATSRVYLARDPFADREVAIKVLFPEDPNDSQLTKRFEYLFQNEAALAGRLVHPHIVAIYDAANTGGYHYTVMEYVPGQTLEAYSTPDNLLSIPEVVEIIWKCSRALAFAHSHGVIHRDIKPGNILLGNERDIKITDFGLALFSRQEQTAIQGIGTPAYMSPEQIREHPLTQQTDIYSLGVVMYRLLTGNLPYTATTQVGLTDQILNGVQVPAIERRPDLPKRLNRIVMRAIHRDMSERYQTWSEFARDLSAFSRGLSESRETLTDTEKFDRLRRLSFFRDFGDVQIWETLRLSAWRALDPGMQVIKEGDVGDSFFILTEGEVSVTREGSVLAILRPGDCFGEMIYFESATARRSTTITTLTHSVVMEIKAQALNRATSDSQVMFIKAFLRILIERLTAANARLAATGGRR